MKRFFYVILAGFILVSSAPAAFAQAEKWQRDLFEILGDIEDRQRDILNRLEAMESSNKDVMAAIEDLKKGQKSYVNPKWTP